MTEEDANPAAITNEQTTFFIVSPFCPLHRTTMSPKAGYSTSFVKANSQLT